MEKKINDAVCRYGMDEIFNGCILGFSGGADSGALLHYLKSRCKNLLAVHINHMIRGEEAFRDEEVCRSTCEKYGVPFKCVRIDIPALSKERKKGLEETARDERYRVFKEILSKNPEYKCIVTAHNSNDNAETVVFNLIRGGGAKGLSGISPINGNVYRPLILATREEIVGYCEKNGIEYVTDSTNSDTDYTRNRIRHNILPLLSDINPAFLDSCSRLGDILRKDEEYIGKEADKILKDCKNGRLEKEVAVNLCEAVLARVLKGLSGENLDYVSFKSISDLIGNWQTGKMVNLHGSLTFKLEHNYCAFVKTDEVKERKEFLAYLKSGENNVCENIICVNCDLSDASYRETGRVRLNSENIVGTLYARNKKEGDTVKSAGVTKKLKKVFTDKHIPSHKRRLIPVICDDIGVVCVAGIIARDGAFDKKGDMIIKVYEKIANGGINEKEE